MSDKRPQIIQAARNLVDNQGYPGLTMKQVADGADISRATLYRYYSTKEELFSDVVYDWGLELVSSMQEQPLRDKTVAARLSMLTRHVIESVANNPRLMAAHIAVLVSDNPVLRRSFRQTKNLMPAIIQLAVGNCEARHTQLTSTTMQHMLTSNLILLSAGKTDADKIIAEMEQIAAILLADVWHLSP